MFASTVRFPVLGHRLHVMRFVTYFSQWSSPSCFRFAIMYRNVEIDLKQKNGIPEAEQKAFAEKKHFFILLLFSALFLLCFQLCFCCAFCLFLAWMSSWTCEMDSFIQENIKITLKLIHVLVACGMKFPMITSKIYIVRQIRWMFLIFLVCSWVDFIFNC